MVSNESPSPRETVIRMIDGYRQAQALHVAATLGIADLLTEGLRRVDELAEATGTDVSALSRLLRALASAGVFAETDDGFCLTPLATCLRSGVPGSLRAWAVHIGQPYFWQTWGHLLESVRTGKPAFPSLYGMSPWEYREAHPEANAIFNQAMTDLAAGVVDAVVESYDFSGIEVLVDVGGGEGALLAAILAAYPTLRGILFDQPHVVTDAPAVFERVGFAARAEVVQGSFFDAAPAGGDAYLLKSIIHDWDDASAVHILRVCRTAIPASGRLLLVERVIQPGNEWGDTHEREPTRRLISTSERSEPGGSRSSGAWSAAPPRSVGSSVASHPDVAGEGTLNRCDRVNVCLGTSRRPSRRLVDAPARP